MLKALGKRMTYANVALTLALVFAMTGGAYAAKKYLITSTKQISPSVLKSLVGKAGPVGPQGSPGAPGAKGQPGAEGKTGLEGKAGTAGQKGLSGATGPTGPTGPTGSPWTAGGTLPAGQTETGTWVFRSEAIEGAEEFDVPISFPIPTAKAGKALFFSNSQVAAEQFGENETTHTKCTVEASEPSCVDTGCRWKLADVEAKPESNTSGTLCIFLQYGSNLGSGLKNIEKIGLQAPGEPSDFEKYGPVGTYMVINKKETAAKPVSLFGVGTWAVNGS